MNEFNQLEDRKTLQRILIIFLIGIIIGFVVSSIAYSKPIATIKISIEGLSTASGHSINDTVFVYISKSGTNRPTDVIDYDKSVINQNTLTAIFNFTRIPKTGNYYLLVKYKNALLTLSQPIYIDINKPINYDFTDSQNKAVGNNLKYLMVNGILFQAM